MATVEDLKKKLPSMSDAELAELHKSDERTTLREAIEAEQGKRAASAEEKPAPSQPWAKPSADAAPAAPASDEQGDEDEDEDEDEEQPSTPEQAPATDEEVALATAERLQGQLEALDEDERAEFDAFMTAQAAAKLDQLTKGREARAMEANLIDGNAHYGTKAFKARNKEVEA